MFEANVYKNRRDVLKTKVKSGVVLILGNNEAPMNYPANTFHYRQDSDFLYFFGLNHAGYAGVIDIDNNKDILFGDDVSMDDIIWMGPQPTMKEQGALIGVENTQSFGDLAAFLKDALKKGRAVHYLPPYRHDNMILLEDLLGIHHKEVKGKASVELIKAVVSMRSIKEDVEIFEIEKACNTAYEMHTAAMKMAMPGIMEQEIFGVVEGISLSHGNPVSFPVILSVNGQTLHNHYHGNKLTEGRMMVTDAGAQTEMFYASDITRTVPVGGKFNTRQREIYEIVLKANMEAIEGVKPGITNKELHLHACKVLAGGLTELGIMKGNVEDAVANGAHALFMPHGLGHMMGLDVHDMEGLGENYVGYDEEISRSTQFGLAALRLGRRLQEGFVFTIEPGCYFIPALIDKWKGESKFTDFINYDKVEEYKDFGGIRIEDDILVTDSGYRVLGKPIPKTVEEVEKTMNA